VVQPGQDWDGDNDTGPLDRPTQGRILAQRQVRARLIVIRRIRSKNSPQVRLTKDQQSVQALAAHGADQAFRIAILPGRSRRDRSVTDSLGASVELRLSKIAHLRLRGQARHPPADALSAAHRGARGWHLRDATRRQAEIFYRLTAEKAAIEEKEQGGGEADEHAADQGGPIAAHDAPSGLQKTP
jgi:hypothetical protein